MKKNLYIFGCSGVGKSICDSIYRSYKYEYERIYFVDTNESLCGTTYYGKKVISIRKLNLTDTENQDVIFSFFKPNDIINRYNFIFKIKSDYRFNIVSIIDDMAVISPSAQIDSGCYIAPGVIIDADSSIGSNCIILFQSVISSCLLYTSPSPRD